MNTLWILWNLEISHVIKVMHLDKSSINTGKAERFTFLVKVDLHSTVHF